MPIDTLLYFLIKNPGSVGISHLSKVDVASNHGLKVLVPEKNIWFAGYSFKRYKLVKRDRYKDRGRGGG
ncbi:hypothetical protein, partial [Pseudomonas viridiflava]|uniref:hypothetical protein n=1 Tax=Pseudomonas viridiflava TaxID=33069 RepID=UPI001E547095